MQLVKYVSRYEALDNWKVRTSRQQNGLVNLVSNEYGSLPNAHPIDLGLGRRPTRSACDSVPQLPRKEVIQPHLPVRLPCYDFTPITDPTLDVCFPSEDRFAQRLQVLPAFVV